MSRKAILAAVVVMGFGVAACDEESTGPDNDQDEIVGTWVSAGADVAPGLAASPFFTDSIIATFNENETYTVLQYYNGNAQPITLTGTYEVGTQPEGQIRAITANQTTPSAVTSEGIFQVSGSGNTMQYEVIQVEPALQGVNAPTVEGGFGSTTVNGVETDGYWTQSYDRRD